VRKFFFAIGSFLVAFGAAYAYNGQQSGQWDLQSFWQWLLSLTYTGSQAMTALSSELNGSGNASEDAAQIAQALIMKFEGFSSHAYPDPAGQTDTYSIGYGHQIVQSDAYDEASVISASDARDLLLADLQTTIACVENAVTAPMTANQEAAFISLCYNIGCGGFSASTAVKEFNAGNTSAAAAAFALWNKAGGSVNETLVSRRQQEADVFNA
jgi:lysozyme